MNVSRIVCGLIAAALLSTTVACALLSTASNAEGALLAATVEFATAKAIENAGPDAASRQAKATKLKSIAVQISAIASGTATVASLTAELTSYASKLSIADQLLANELIALLAADVQLKVNGGLLSTAVSAQVSQVMADVELACAAYGAP